MDSQKRERKRIHDAEEFREFKESLKNGFVTSDAQVTNSKLLALSEKLAAILKSSDRRDTVNQFRKFFNQVSGLKKSGSNASKLEGELRMLKARMSYAAGRNIISQDFRIVINECIDTIITCEDVQTQLSGFCEFFESLYAYYYYYTERNRRQRRR